MFMDFEIIDMDMVAWPHLSVKKINFRHILMQMWPL